MCLHTPVAWTLVMLCLAIAACVLSWGAPTTPTCQQHVVLFPSFSVLLPLFVQEGGGLFKN